MTCNRTDWIVSRIFFLLIHNYYNQLQQASYQSWINILCLPWSVTWPCHSACSAVQGWSYKDIRVDHQQNQHFQQAQLLMVSYGKYWPCFAQEHHGNRTRPISANRKIVTHRNQPMALLGDPSDSQRHVVEPNKGNQQATQCGIQTKPSSHSMWHEPVWFRQFELKKNLGLLTNF